jgi:hypothetical protein
MPVPETNPAPVKMALEKFAIAAALIALPGMMSFATSAQAQAQGLSARYSIDMIGFSVGSAHLSGVFGPDAYKIEARAKMSGLAKAITKAEGAAQSSGQVRSGRVLPAGYATTSSNSKETRTVRMGMTAGNVRGVEISPPIPDRPGRIALKANHKRNIIDPLSALVFTVAGDAPINGTTACNRTLPVFDGYTRFDISLRYAGTRKVKVRGYSGTVFVCKARYRPIAGHRADRKATQFMADNKKMEIWLAPLGASRVLAPYKIAVNTMIGMVSIQAQSFQISGSPATATVRR